MEWFNNGSIPRIINGFPYVERVCEYCRRDMKMVSAIHLSEDPKEYKALFVCFNEQCKAYDEEAQMAYKRVYYSSERAYKMLELNRIWFPSMRKE